MGVRVDQREESKSPVEPRQQISSRAEEMRVSMGACGAECLACEKIHSRDSFLRKILMAACEQLMQNKNGLMLSTTSKNQTVMNN